MCSFPPGMRIMLKRERPNPLFQEWLEELHEEAKAKRSKLEPMLCEALASLQRFPLKLNTGAECIILQGFNHRLCTFLDKRLEVYRSNSQLLSTNGANESSDEVPAPSRPIEDNSLNSNESAPSPRKKLNNSRNPYRPAFRSGGYAILITLLEHSKENPRKQSLTKKELIEKGQKYSEESFVRPKPDTFYTAWSNMSRLVSKGLVNNSGSRNKQYSLTAEGIALANDLLKLYANKPTANDIIFNGASQSVDPPVLEENSQDVENRENNDGASSQSDVPDICVEMAAGDFDVILLIDKNETGGTSNINDPTVSQFNKYPDLKHEYRSLKVGDFTWIARHKLNKDQELVLPYVVERKRMDDLGHSIKDGRFHEQKFRLRKCGLKNVIYLIENCGKNANVGLPIQSLKQAIVNTRVQDGFRVHVTDSLHFSVRFLAMMTKRLTIEFKDKNLRGWNKEPTGEELMIFQYFNSASAKSKPLTVTEAFIKLLLQLKGVSVEKALAITGIYSTPTALIRAYNRCHAAEGEMLLASLKFGDLGRNVGPAISKSIYRLFSV